MKMTSFGWKRKVSDLTSGNKTKAFDDTEQVDSDVEEQGTDFDWISVAKKRKLEALEDNKALFSRLKKEGTILAEEGKFWQAINRWDNALSLDPSDETVFEMKAQALINLHEWIPAIRAAEQCIKLKPNWFIGLQTLGRAQMGLGEVELAVRSFASAVHLNPGDMELRKDDLEWALDLLKQKRQNNENGIEEDTVVKADSEDKKSIEHLVKIRTKSNW